MNISRQLLRALTLSACTLVAAHAQAAGYERGPAPTAALLDATGPYELSA